MKKILFYGATVLCAIAALAFFAYRTYLDMQLPDDDIWMGKGDTVITCFMLMLYMLPLVAIYFGVRNLLFHPLRTCGRTMGRVLLVICGSLLFTVYCWAWVTM